MIEQEVRKVMKQEIKEAMLSWVNERDGAEKHMLNYYDGDHPSSFMSHYNKLFTRKLSLRSNLYDQKLIFECLHELKIENKIFEMPVANYFMLYATDHGMRKS